MKQRAAFVSVAVHLMLGLALLMPATKQSSKLESSHALEFEIVAEQAFAPMPQLSDLPRVAAVRTAPDDIASPPHPPLRPPRKTPKHLGHTKAQAPPTIPEDGAESVAPGPNGIAQVPSSGETTPQHTDGLWSFRPVAPSLPPVLLGKPAAEDPNALFRHAAPNVIKNPREPGPLGTVEGRGGVKMNVGEDGRIESFEQPKARGGFALGPGTIGVGATFDTTDEIMRATGSNPYRYEEHRLAEATREQRICQMMEAAKRDTREALFNLKHRLASLWKLEEISLPRRRELLFELWDECLEDSSADSAGAMAKATIEAFIREALPQNSPAAFTPKELAMLNQRRTSARRFAPYTSVRRDAGVGL